MLPWEGKLRKPHIAMPYLFPHVQAPTLQLWCMHGTVRDYIGANKVKDQLLYLNFAALTVGRVIWFEAFLVIIPFCTSIF